MTDDPITALLDQLAAHAERIDRLDARAAGDYAAAAGQLATLATLAGRLDAQVAVLAAQLDGSAGEAGRQQADDQDGDGERAGQYSPAPVRRWWKLSGEDRAQAIGTLRAWVEQVYKPGYGELAATLGPCWDQHALCLYAIDVLAELWSVLYLNASRTPAALSAQAEYQARILPALAEQMRTETTRCRHARDHVTVSTRDGRTR